MLMQKGKCVLVRVLCCHANKCVWWYTLLCSRASTANKQEVKNLTNVDHKQTHTAGACVASFKTSDRILACSAASNG
jgi:hypothetical protein